MILGMSTSAFTLLHVVLSLIGIVAGIVVAAAMLELQDNQWLDGALSRNDGPDQRHGFSVPE